MGTMQYASDLPSVEVEDRLLAHLHLVISERYRNSESFYLQLPVREVEGRAVLWMDHKIPLRLTYRDPLSPQINLRWVNEMLSSSRSSGAPLVVGPEPVMV